jgi:flagellin
MSAVTTNAHSATVLMLQDIHRNFQKAQTRVSTGVAISSAIDDSARYELSSRLMARSHLVNSVNNNISSTLKTLETTDETIRTMVSLLDQASDVAGRALGRGVGSFQGVRSTTDINETTLVSALAVPGSRLTIVMDGGQQFTYTFGAAAATTRWGEVVNAVNSANIGVIAEYMPATAPSINNLRFRSTDGRDFRFGGDSDRNIIAALGAITSGTGGALNIADQFVLGAAAPTAAHTGFTISFGGAVQSAVNVTGATVIDAGSALTFGNPAGNYFTWFTTTATTVAAAITAINGMNVGVIAELANSGPGTTALRLRSASGDDLEITAGSGSFVGPAGAARFGSATDIHQTGYSADFRADHSMRLIYGTQYDDIIAHIGLLARNNPAPPGRNLLRGESTYAMLGTTASMVWVQGRDVSTANLLGLNQAGSTWTSFSNVLTSMRQVAAARATLLDLAARFGQSQSFLADRFAINRDYSSNLSGLGRDLIAADIGEESAKMTALQTQQQLAVQALASGVINRQSLAQILERE